MSKRLNQFISLTVLIGQFLLFNIILKGYSLSLFWSYKVNEFWTIILTFLRKIISATLVSNIFIITSLCVCTMIHVKDSVHIFFSWHGWVLHLDSYAVIYTMNLFTLKSNVREFSRSNLHKSFDLKVYSSSSSLSSKISAV